MDQNQTSQGATTSDQPSTDLPNQTTNEPQETGMPIGGQVTPQAADTTAPGGGSMPSSTPPSDTPMGAGATPMPDTPPEGVKAEEVKPPLVPTTPTSGMGGGSDTSGQSSQ